MSNIAEKLRTEILDSKQKRHDFVMRKFAMTSLFLGAGSLSGEEILSKLSFNLASLLYLVPLIAIAFDLYIITEDYRIKRAGEFLRRDESCACPAECAWELFAKEHPNNTSTYAYGLVTMIYLVGSAFVLSQTNPNEKVFWAWLIAICVIEVMLVIYGARIRKSLEGANPPPRKPNGKKK